MEKPYPKINDAAVLVGGGEIYPSDVAILKKLPYRVFCADGGVRNARAFGLSPVAVIGDMDSCDPADLAGVERVETPDQNQTDFEKSLVHIGSNCVFCFGFWGKRLDHSLAALSVMAQRRQSHPILFSDEDICFRAPKHLHLKLGSGDPIAFFPMSDVRAKSKGLAYPLDGLDLTPAGQISSSNQAEGAVVLDDVNGDLLVIVPKRFLDVVLEALTA